MVASGNRIVTANDQTVTAYRTPNFTPVGAAGFGLEADPRRGRRERPDRDRPDDRTGGRPHLRRPRDRDRSDEDARAVRGHGRLRTRRASASPPAGAYFVADRDGGKVELLTVNGGQLVAGSEHDAGSQPAGRLIAFRDNLFVPVAGGVAVLDLASGSLQRTIKLPARPSDIWVASTGRLFAALPSLGKVAVADVTAPSLRPRLVVVGKGAASLGGGRLASGDEAVYLANQANGRVARLDPLTGRVVTSRVVGALKQATPPVAEGQRRHVHERRREGDRRHPPGRGHPRRPGSRHQGRPDQPRQRHGRDVAGRHRDEGRPQAGVRAEDRVHAAAGPADRDRRGEARAPSPTWP